MTTTTERTMRAVLQDRYGTSTVLGLGRVALPVVGDHDVLVDVRAAGMDRGTEHLMTGKPYAMRLATGLRHPRNPVPGRDVAGIVADVGSAVTRFRRLPTSSRRPLALTEYVPITTAVTLRGTRPVDRNQPLPEAVLSQSCNFAREPEEPCAILPKSPWTPASPAGQCWTSHHECVYMWRHR